jgi:hypothetical protein
MKELGVFRDEKRPLMVCLRRTVSGDWQIALPQPPMKEFQGSFKGLLTGNGVPSRPFISQECMLSIVFVELKQCTSGLQSIIDLSTTLGWHVRILPAKDQDDRPLDFCNPIKAIVVHPFAERSLVDVCWIKAGGSPHLGIHGSTEGQMATYTKPGGSENPGTPGMCLKKTQYSPGVGVIAGEFLRDLEGVSSFSSSGVVRKHCASRLELMVNFRYGDQITGSGKSGGQPSDGTCDLEDFTIEKNSWIFSRRGGLKDYGPHGPVRGCEFNDFIGMDSHECLLIPDRIDRIFVNSQVESFSPFF